MPATYDRVGERRGFSRPARVGDVVAFVHPDSASCDAEQQVVRARRVAALAGDVLVSGGDEETSPETSETATYEIPSPRRAWITADNDATDSSRAPDSARRPDRRRRHHARVVYYVRSATDHGPVANHPASADEDAAVLAYGGGGPTAPPEDLGQPRQAEERPATPPP